ncbi:MAG: hypothetical protein NVS3B18_09840 [Candidatus Dormibacteria bacterium]
MVRRRTDRERPAGHNGPMGSGNGQLVPGVVCPACGGDRLVPLTFQAHGNVEGISERLVRGTPDVKCLACAKRFKQRLHRPG